jgi:tripartite-type tricarboxylate transporter receptor subunit TctC
MRRRHLIAAAALGAFPVASRAKAQAAAFPQPNRPITLMVGFGAGGATDTPARLIALHMQRLLGVPVVIENRPGANQMVAIQRVIAAPPDGHVLYVGTGSSLSQNPALRPSLGLDPVRDFTPVARYGVASGVFNVRSNLPVQSMRELIEYIRANPGRVSYGSSGAGTANHLSTEYFATLLGLDLIHVPYRSDAQAGLEISEGRIDFILNTLAVGLPLIQGRRVRGMALTAMDPLSFAPGVPGLREAGAPELEGLDPFTYYGLVGPANMPADIVAKLNAAVNEAVRTPEIARRFRETMYLEPVAGSPEEFADYNAAQFRKWAEAGRRIRINWTE